MQSASVSVTILSFMALGIGVAQTHIVTSYTADVAFGGETLVHEGLTDGTQVFAPCDTPSEEVDDFLVTHAVPDTIASQDEEVFIARDIVGVDFGIGSDDLALLGESRVALELKVADGSGESQVAVHSATFNEASSANDACIFICVKDRGDGVAQSKRVVKGQQKSLVDGRRLMTLYSYSPSFMGL